MLIPLLIGGIATLNTIAQILLKQGSGKGLTSFYVWGGLLIYGLSAVFYISLLSKVNLSFAYPVTIGLTITATALMGAALFRERVLPLHWLGISLIISGIWAIALAKEN
jgi:multidrug transporter EmrE-like cation transporter